jgi:tetratricopeptide (TPR) repeat protein
LATASHDRTIKLWDVATGQERVTLKGHKAPVRSLAIAPNGNLLASGSEDGTLKLWRAATEKPARALKTDLDWDDPDSPVAQNDLGDRLLATGRFKQAEAAYRRAQTRLEKLAAAFPDSPWHRQELARSHLSLAQTYRQQNELEKAIADYSKAIELDPKNAERWNDRADAFAALAQWDKASADFSKAIELSPENMVIRYWFALTQVGAGDLAGYHRACAALLDRFGQGDLSDRVCWVLVLAPDAVKDRNRPVHLAEALLRKDPQTGWASTILGAALYRAGRFAEAVQRLTEASAAWEQAATKPEAYSPAYIWFFLAIAHQHLGHAAEARRWLDKARNWMDKETQNPRNVAWNRRLTLQWLRREAEALLKEAATNQRGKQEGTRAKPPAP